MGRLKLAGQAKRLGRQIYASTPHHMRMAAVLHKVAFGSDTTSLGLAVLHAMVQAGVEGDVSGTPLDEIATLIKRGGSKVYKVADHLANILIKKSLGKYHGTIRDEAISKVTDNLFSQNPLRRGSSVAEAISYISKALWMAASKLHRSRGQDLKMQRHAPNMVDNFMSNPRLWAKIPESALQPVYRELQKNPIFQGDDGSPRMYLYLSGLADGLSERAIAEQLGMSSQAMSKWIAHPTRQRALKKAVAPLLPFFEAGKFAHFVGASSAGIPAPAARASARSKALNKLFSDMMALQPKVDRADTTASDRFEKAYDKLYATGKEAAKEGQDLIKKLTSVVKAGSEAFHALRMVQHKVRDWERNEPDYIRSRSEYSSERKLLRAEQTLAYALSINDWILRLHTELKNAKVASRPLSV